MRFSKKGELAVAPVTFTKIETELKGGIAQNASRTTIIKTTLLMSYLWEGRLIPEGTTVLLRGFAGNNPWARQSYQLNDMTFSLCPEAEVVGFEDEKNTINWGCSC